MHESYNLYNDAEKKMIQAENQVYNLKNFIIIKSREMNYEQSRDECRTLVDELNKLIIKNLWIIKVKYYFIFLIFEIILDKN